MGELADRTRPQTLDEDGSKRRLNNRKAAPQAPQALERNGQGVR